MSEAGNNQRPMRNIPSTPPSGQDGPVDDRVGGHVAETIGAPIRGSRFSTTGEQRMSRRIVLAFAPLHKAAFGVAVGAVCGVALAVVTIADLLLDPQRRVGLDLISQYLYGYTVSPAGVVIGFLWATVVGFVAGWFMAFTRNAMMALWVLYFRARADWIATGDFLDHI